MMTLRSLFSLATVLAALLALAGCEQDSNLTQVIVVVHADSDEVAEKLTTIRARVLSADGKADALPEREKEFSLAPKGIAGSGEPTLPFSFAVTKNQASRFLLVLSGYSSQSSEPVIEQRLTVSFREGHTIYVDVLLGRACLGQASACAALDQTCHPLATDLAPAGACGPVLDATSRRAEPGRELDAGLLSEPDVDAEGPGEADADPGADSSDAGLDSQAPVDAASDATPGLSNAAASGLDAANDAGTTLPAEAGAVCEGATAKTCDGNASRQKLACVGGQWAPNGSCDGDTRCQTRSDSPDLGNCLPIVSACVGKQPGSAVCDGTVRRSCGPDLVDYTANPCPAHASCRDQGGNVSCACDAPYMSDGMGGCTVPICMQMPCQNGGICSISGTGRSCDCSAVDYSGTSCETRIDDCATSPCAHGRCVDGVRSRTCDCTNSGYEGPTCATNINECATVVASPCAGTRASGMMFNLSCVETQAPGYSCQGQFAEWPMPDSAAGAKFAPSYDTSTAGIVRDAVTGLIWQRDTPSTYDSCTGQTAAPRDSCFLEQARRYCTFLTLGGRSDWRLPSKIELESLIDTTRQDPAANPAFGFRTGSWTYWTDSAVTGSDGAYHYWYTDFSRGATYQDFQERLDSQYRAYLVRCVASAPPPPGTPDSRYVVNEAANTVTDTRTTLIWQRTDQQGIYDYDAPANCSAPWRLPTFKELLTLVDPTRIPTISPVFRGLTAVAEADVGYAWSSTIAGYRRPVFFLLGAGGAQATSDRGSVRCVR